VLTPSEAEQLFVAVNRLKAAGRGIVFISHRLGEIRQVCDDLTVLRRGKVVFDGDAQSLSNAELAQIMVGREIAPLRLQRDGPSARPLMLEASGLTAGKLRDASLRIHGGEILGIAGVDGNGQQELAEVLVGLRSAGAGTVRLAGHDITRRSASERFVIGMAHIPNDRKAEGLVGTMSVAENLVLKQYNTEPFSRGGFLSLRQMRNTARQMVERFDIRASGVDAPVATLSGGNAQKVILARELGLREPRAIVAINPSRGLDLAATEFVHQQLLDIRKQGGAVLLISSELEELFALCDRIAVLFAGRLTMSDFPVGGVKSIGQLMTGAAPGGSAA
jgi:simple sugar transport system ATP-binding protein